VPSDKPFYRITVKGRLNADWAEWFNPLSVSHEPNGDTVLSGPVTDQAELFGLLLRIRDLGLSLESVIRIESTTPRAQRKNELETKEVSET
jgi:hypothetical protein